jgi:hypothetical protein
MVRNKSGFLSFHIIASISATWSKAQAHEPIKLAGILFWKRLGTAGFAALSIEAAWISCPYQR